MQKRYNTKTGKKIAEYIAGLDDMDFSAADAYSYMRKNGMPVHLATIYRNLDKLTEENRLIKFKSVGNGSYLYRKVTKDSGCREKLLIRCKKCGKVIYFDNDFVNRINAAISGSCGFVLECKGSSLCGFCKECQ